MTDRELLELAAKAAGYKVDEKKKVSVYEEQNWLPMVYPQGDVPNLWNPLIDDSDALRLAVKIGRIESFDLLLGRDVVHIDFDDGSGRNITILHESDPYAATRRAIVRAAAAIGEQMK